MMRPEGRASRIVALANNWVGWQVVAWLRDRGDDLVGLVVHPPELRRHGDELLAAAALPPERVFDGSRLREPETIAAIAALGPDIGVSLMFRYLLQPELLALLPRGVLNLHPSYLPFNRGLNPNVWALVDRTPAGVSLHWVDGGVDTGPIVARREVEVEPIDTGGTLYRKLERAAVALFQETWPAVVAGRAAAVPQLASEGSHHGRQDLERLDRIDPERRMPAGELIDLLRARTFPPYRGAYIERGGRRVYLRLELEYGDDE
jgi:methionyl-tRNA formyltransferase